MGNAISSTMRRKMNDSSVHTITFVVPGRPIGKQSLARDPRSGRSFLPEKSREWMKLVRVMARRVAPPEPWLGAVVVTITAVFAPGSRPYTNARPDLGDEPTCKPDWDNISKGACDAMSHIIYNDDAQIIKGTLEKIFGEVDQTIVTVTRLTDQPTQTQLGIPMKPKRRRRKKP